MSITSEINRIATLRDTIRSKLLDLGIITNTTAKLSTCSEAIDGISESTISASAISITPDISVDMTTGVVTVSGGGTGTVSATKGYSKGTSSEIPITASGTLQLEIYDGTVEEA